MLSIATESLASSAMLCPFWFSGNPMASWPSGAKRRNVFSERDLALTEQIGFHLSHAITQSPRPMIRFVNLKDQLSRKTSICGKKWARR